MMFSTIMTVKPQSRLHGKLPLLQHIVALSVVSAIRTIPGYEVCVCVCCECVCVCVCVCCECVL